MKEKDYPQTNRRVKLEQDNDQQGDIKLLERQVPPEKPTNSNELSRRVAQTQFNEGACR